MKQCAACLGTGTRKVVLDGLPVEKMCTPCFGTGKRGRHRR